MDHQGLSATIRSEEEAKKDPSLESSEKTWFPSLWQLIMAALGNQHTISKALLPGRKRWSERMGCQAQMSLGTTTEGLEE
jgi:hypothetical protein